MLPLSAIRDVRATVDADWRSPVADAVAARWGFAPGAARWWRSSATHVFVVPPDGDRGALYLRFVPAALREAASIGAPARLLAAIAGDGGAVVVPVPSLDGHLVESVDTPLGRMHAVAVPAAPGEEREADDLAPAEAHAWGAALAAFHRDAAPHHGTVGAMGHEPSVRELAAAVPDDAPLAEAAAALATASEEAGVALETRGVLHGDFELDNLRWDEGVAVAFDADETRVGPYTDDIASAVRDLVGQDWAAPSHPHLLDAFLDGYASLRPLTDAERADLPLAAARNALRALVRGADVLDAGDGPGDEEWLVDLRAAIAEHDARARALVLAVAASATGSTGTSAAVGAGSVGRA